MTTLTILAVTPTIIECVFLFVALATVGVGLLSQFQTSAPDAAAVCAAGLETPVFDELPPDNPHEVCLCLQNGKRLYSGWVDHADPGRLVAGDYIRLEDQNGRELCYFESADLLADPTTGRRMLCELFRMAHA